MEAKITTTSDDRRAALEVEVASEAIHAMGDHFDGWIENGTTEFVGSRIIRIAEAIAMARMKEQNRCVKTIEEASPILLNAGAFATLIRGS